MEGRPSPDSAPHPDPLARALRAVLGSVAFRVGALVGVGTVVFTGLLVVLVGLIPSSALESALGLEVERGESVTTSARVARSLLFPWIAQTEIQAEEVSFGLRTLLPLPTLFLLGALALGGAYARRVVPRSARHRAGALVAAASTAAILVAILAATLGYRYSEEGFTRDYGFSAGLYFLVALVEVVVVGAFSFGVVRLLPETIRVPARTAGAVFGATFVVGVLAFPFAVVAGTPTGDDANRDVPSDLANASAWAAGAASAVLPLGLGAKAHLEADAGTSPFRRFSDQGERTYWPELARYTEERASARLTGYSGVGGIGWKLVGFLGALLVVGVWILAAIRAVRLLGAPRSLDGLVRGALVGVFGGFLLIIVAWLSAFSTTFVGFEDFNGFDGIRWGMAAGGTAQAVFELIALTAIAGAVYAAFRPTPYRIAPRRPAVALPAWMWPAPTAAAPDAPPDIGPPAESAAPEAPAQPTARYCSRCGAAFPDDTAAFCTSCGAPRS